MFDESFLRKLSKQKPVIGNDIDVESFEIKDAPNVKPDEKRLRKVGIDLKGSASFVQDNEKALYKNINKMFEGKLEIMPIDEALKKYEWLNEYYFNAVKMEDKFTAYSELLKRNGYFLRVFAGQKIDIPIQACFLISTNNTIQNVHNIIIIEDGAEAQMINGCTVQYQAKRTLHLAVTEIYLKKNSKFIYNMIHNWSKESYVRPRTGVILEDNSRFISNYVTLYPIKDIQSYPIALCKGKNSSATFRSIVCAKESSTLDLGGKIILDGAGSRGEIISHAVVRDTSFHAARSHIVANGLGVKGHIECKGIMLSDNARMDAVPVLESHTKGAELTHEASIGKIDEEQLDYLMSRGFSEDEAISLIVRGFLDVEEMELSPYIKEFVRKLIEKTSEGF